jgi:hypothetical protein
MSGTKRWLTLITIVVASVTLAGQDKGAKASNGWVKLPDSGKTDAMAFVTVENPGMYEINITSAASAAANKVELRDADQAVTFINVPSYGRIDMSASGAHLMLIGLKRALKEGDTVALTLATDMDVKLDVTATVRGQ